MSEDSAKGTDTYPSEKEIERRKSSDLAKRAATARVARATKKPASGLIALLARRTKRSVEEVTEGIPEDTLRRTKYPFNVTENDDGTLTFTDPKVVPGAQVRSAPTQPGSKRDAARGGVQTQRN